MGGPATWIYQPHTCSVKEQAIGLVCTVQHLLECAVQGDSGRVVSYDGFDESLAFIKDYIALHGPFDGLWAFSQASRDLQSLLYCIERLCQVATTSVRDLWSLFWGYVSACASSPPDADVVMLLQGTILASLLLAMQQKGILLQVKLKHTAGCLGAVLMPTQTINLAP